MSPTKTVLTLCVMAGAAYADNNAGASQPDPNATQPAPPPSSGGGTATDSAVTGAEPAPAKETPVEYGVGIRLRSVYVPQSIMQIFVDKAPGGAHNYGYGVDITRRRGDTELQLGVEFEHVTPTEGIYINRGDTVPADSVDWLVSPKDAGNKDFGWFTIDFTFFHSAKINQYVNFRYGAGLGLGIVLGEVDHYNVVCAPGSTNESPDPGCRPTTFGGTGTDEDGKGFQQLAKYDTPSVFPVVNAIIGFQLKPTDKMSINIEGGIRTLPFIGIEAGYFF